ncbi:MAG: hypothetical protein ACLGHQ_08360 [Acidimicrobiia bacterium]
MSTSIHRSARVPRAGVDPITDHATALALLGVAACPTRHETILVLLDDARRGLGLVVVTGTVDPDAVVEVADRVLDPAAHDGCVAAVVVATVRPPDGDVHGARGDDLGDADRWLELDDVARRAGVRLVEWYVLGGGLSLPRELVNAPPRW